MQDPLVTIVVVPRERFSYAERSLDNIYAHTALPFRLVYVGAGTPPSHRSRLERAARERGFELILMDRYLSPNQARNLGQRRTTTKYVVFLDNDSLVTDGWLEALVRCAEETGAWVVGPLYLIGELKNQTIHMAGGVAHIREESGQRVLYDEHLMADMPLANLRGPLRRRECDYVEFHCALVRNDVFERLGPLDEELLSAHEHIDLGLCVRRAGGSVFLEPRAVTTFIPPPGEWRDLPYFMVRWSESWNRATVRHFNEKWGWSVVRSIDEEANPGPDDTILRWARTYRGQMAGLHIPLEGGDDRPESPLEEAQCAVALLQCLDRESFDLMLTTGDEQPIEDVRHLDPQAVMEWLPGALTRAVDENLNVLIRSWPQPDSHPVVVLRLDDLPPQRLNLLRSRSFLVLETAPQTYQCWLAILKGDPRSTAAWRKLGLTARAEEPCYVRLAGTRTINPELRRADGSYPRVRFIEGETGLLNPLWKLEEDGLLPYLRNAHLS